MSDADDKRDNEIMDQHFVKAMTVLANSLGTLRSSIENMRLVDYMMTCSRIPPEQYLPHPPSREDFSFVEPDSQEEKEKIEALIEASRVIYRRVQFMLAEDCATESERVRIEKHVAFVHMHSWLRDTFTWKDIVKMPTPVSMDYTKQIVLRKECDGTQSTDGKECMFIGIENMQRFEDYVDNRNTVKRV